MVLPKSKLIHFNLQEISLDFKDNTKFQGGLDHIEGTYDLILSDKLLLYMDLEPKEREKYLEGNGYLEYFQTPQSNRWASKESFSAAVQIDYATGELSIADKEDYPENFLTTLDYNRSQVVLYENEKTFELRLEGNKLYLGVETNKDMNKNNCINVTQKRDIIESEDEFEIE